MNFHLHLNHGVIWRILNGRLTCIKKMHKTRARQVLFAFLPTTPFSITELSLVPEIRWNALVLRFPKCGKFRMKSDLKATVCLCSLGKRTHQCTAKWIGAVYCILYQIQPTIHQITAWSGNAMKSNFATTLHKNHEDIPQFMLRTARI